MTIPTTREGRDLAPAARLDSLQVLLTGPSGSGKSLVARVLHENSGRRSSPFVEVNCAAIPASLWEAEFFGSTRHAYTQASERAGRFADRIKNPVRAYAAAEAGIGLYALLIPVILWAYPGFNSWMYRVFGDRWLLLSMVRFAGSAALLLIPTTLMGATLPLLARHFGGITFDYSRKLLWLRNPGQNRVFAGDTAAWTVPAAQPRQALAQADHDDDALADAVQARQSKPAAAAPPARRVGLDSDYEYGSGGQAFFTCLPLGVGDVGGGLAPFALGRLPP